MYLRHVSLSCFLESFFFFQSKNLGFVGILDTWTPEKLELLSSHTWFGKRVIYVFFNILKKINVISLFLRDREREWAGEGQRERERENPKQAPGCQHRAWCGARTYKLWDHDPSRNQRVGCLTNWATQVPLCMFFIFIFIFIFESLFSAIILVPSVGHLPSAMVHYFRSSHGAVGTFN